MGNKRNRKKSKKPRFSVSKSGSSSTKSGFPCKKAHNTRLSVRRVAENRRKKTKAPVINPHIDGFGNSMRKNTYKPKAIEAKPDKVSLLVLRNRISKLRGYNTRIGYRAVAVQCKKNIFENHLIA